MLRSTLTTVFVFLFLISFSQISQNVSLKGTWNPGGQSFSDIWGYSNGSTEVAIIGSTQRINFVNVTNPASPSLITYFTTGYSSNWRDFKTYGTYLYAVADQGSEGLRIYNMVNVPTNVMFVASITTHFTRAHNIFIDQAAARLYVVGGTVSDGVMIFDLSTPTNPTLLADLDLGDFGGPTSSYVHDIHVIGNIGYCSHVYDHSLYIYDFTNPTSPVEIGHIDNYLEEGLNHSSWLDDTGSYLVFADETHGKGLKIMDITEPDNLGVNFNNIFRSDLLNLGTSIAHNPFILGDYCYVSYYHDGVQIFDISNPTNVVKVGYYDTYPANTDYTGFQGCWGVYPYLPSGNIIASDMSNGLFVLEFNPPVPVELTDFRGRMVDQKVELVWETASEKDNEKFLIERSHDGISFLEIGTKKGNGTTLEPSFYNFFDESPQKGINYYRLRQVDTDGKFEFSPVIEINYNQLTSLKVYPTVLHRGQLLTLEFDRILENECYAQVIDMNGKLLYETTIEPLNEKISLPELRMQPGIHIVRLSSRNFTFTQKVFVTR